MECVRRTAGLTFSYVRNIEAGKYDVKIDVLAQIAKTHEDNVFAQVQRGNDSFEAAAIPINNVWHSPMVDPPLVRGRHPASSEGSEPDATHPCSARSKDSGIPEDAPQLEVRIYLLDPGIVLQELLVL